MKTTQIAVSCGTRFHADYLTHHLHLQYRRVRAITAHSRARFRDRVDIPLSSIDATFPYFAPAYLVNRLGRGYAASFGEWVDRQAILLFDRAAAKYCQNVDVLVAWSRSSLKQMEAVRKRGGFALIERVSSHTRFQHELLESESVKLGLRPPEAPHPLLLEREDIEYSLANKILCPSNHVRDSFLAQGHPKENLAVNAYGVNTDRFHPTALERNSEFTVLFVGTVGVRKGAHHFLEAAKRLRSEKGMRFVMIGRIEPSFVKHYAAFADYVTHFDVVPNSELPRMYQQASVFLFPSLDEGMAYVLMEAQACGLPLIATRNSGADAIVQDGKNGYLIPTGNVDQIVQCMLELKRDPEKLEMFRQTAISNGPRRSWAEHAIGVGIQIDSLLSNVLM